VAKPPVDTYQKMINFIQSQLRSKKFVANYQPVMIKFLLQNGNQSKQQIAQELWKQNNAQRDSSFYLGVPVYRVLVDNGVVTKQGNIFSLVLQDMTELEKQSIIDEIDSSISRHTEFAKTGYLPLDKAKVKARELAKQYDLKDTKDWNEFAKSGNKPDNIPSDPSSFYKKKKTSKDNA
jgi:hypothetical protein